jgi:hypothetical protein
MENIIPGSQKKVQSKRPTSASSIAAPKRKINSSRPKSASGTSLSYQPHFTS